MARGKAKKTKAAAVDAAAAGVPEPEEQLAALLDLPTTARGDFVPINTMIQYQQFVSGVRATGTSTQAARDAGFSAPNDNAMRQLASRLMQNPHVRDMLTEQYTALLAKLKATPERIWQEIVHMAFLDPAAFYNEDGTVKTMHQIPEEARRALTGYDIEEKTFGEMTIVTRKVRYNSKVDGIKRLLKLHGMLNDDKLVVLNGDEFMQALEAGRARAAQKPPAIAEKAKAAHGREQRER